MRGFYSCAWVHGIKNDAKIIATLNLLHPLGWGVNMKDAKKLIFAFSGRNFTAIVLNRGGGLVMQKLIVIFILSAVQGFSKTE